MIITIDKMCLLFFYINNRAVLNQYKLILVNNRDEFYSRPTEKAQIWRSNPKIVSGRDCEEGREGGVWLGASETGRISCLLNVFQPKDAIKQNVTGRGFLAANFLQNNKSSHEYFKSINDSNINYNLFNLLLFQLKANNYEVLYYNNVDKTSTLLDTNKVHGFGNCLISKDFKKVQIGKKFLEDIVKDYGYKEKETDLKKSLFGMMMNKQPFYPDETLSKQGAGYDEKFIKGLSSIWVSMKGVDYGTRTTTVILVDSNNRLTFSERTMETPSTECKEFITSDFTLDLISTELCSSI